MRLTFRDTYKDAYRRSGTLGLLAPRLPTLFDLLKLALEERARQGEITMSKERFIGLAGPLTCVVGALLLAGPIGDLVWLVRPSETLWEFFHFHLSTAAFVLMLPAFIATRLRYQKDAHRLGRPGLILSVAGAGVICLLVLASRLLQRASPLDLNWLNPLAVISVLSILIGHTLFGVDALRYKLLPQWNAVPLLVGLTAPLLVLLSMIIESALGIDRSQIEVTLISLFTLFTGLWWVLMGIAMMGQRREPQLTAAV